MRLKFESDIHIEFHSYNPNLENIDIYILAGDVAQKTKGMLWAIELLKKNPKLCIIYVAGNHCYYSSNIQSVDNKLRDLSSLYSRLHFLQNDTVVINGIRFIGSTMWTDFNKSNPIDMNDAQNGMNDYKCIRYHNGESRFTPYHSVRLHKEAKEYIFSTLQESEEPCIVITHHKPFCTNNNYLSSAFEVELRNDLSYSNKVPIIWHSGHDHKYHDLEFEFPNGSTRFISNPLGYPGERTNFDPNLEVDIEVVV